MTQSAMEHEDAREALEALVLDALSPPEREAMLAHMKECSVCRHEFGRYEEAVVELAYAVRPLPMTDGVRERVRMRLLRRVAAERPGGTSARRESERFALQGMADPSRTSGPTGTEPFHILIPDGTDFEAAEGTRTTLRLAWVVGVAACIAAAASVATLYQLSHDRDVAAAQYLALSSDRDARHAIDSLRTMITDRDRMIARMSGAGVMVVNLAAATDSGPSAHMFWDQAAGTWTLVAHNLPAPSQGRAYQIWLVTRGQKISAGMFAPGANGEAVVRATYAMPKADLMAVAVTDEPMTGSAQPSTPALLTGGMPAR
ncbi:MAG: anti-sigma factor [bacterium]